MAKQKCALIVGLLVITLTGFSQKRIIPGAERLNEYLPLLKGKNVALFANQTSMVGNTHLVDTLIKRGVKIVRILARNTDFEETPMLAKKWVMPLIKKPELK